MHRTPMIAAIVRLGFGLLTLVAIGRQLARQLHLGLSPFNFFGYFTILSNGFAGVVLVCGGLALLRRRELGPAGELIRGASVAMMALVGIGFSILLRGADLGPLLPWVPRAVGGYGGVALYCLGIVAGFVAVSWLLVLSANRGRGKPQGPRQAISLP